MSNLQAQAALWLRSAAKPVGERQPEAGWIGGPAADEHTSGLPQKIAATSYIGCPAASPRQPDYPHQLTRLRCWYCT